MAVADTLQELATDIQSAYTSISNKGGTIPANKNTNNLATAINSISAGDDNELVNLINRTITEIENENVTSIGRSAFAYCQSLTKIIVKNCLSVGRDSLSNNYHLTLADLGQTTSIDNYAFDYCSRLDVVVLRNTTRVCSIQNNTFRATKMASGGTGGTVYVPRDLVSSYQANASWSALAITFLAIEDNIATLEALGLNVDEFKE